MSENQQEEATEETQLPPSPGHQGGPVPPAEQPDTADRDVSVDDVDEPGAGHPHRLEPRAGRDS